MKKKTIDDNKNSSDANEYEIFKEIWSENRSIENSSDKNFETNIIFDNPGMCANNI